MSDIQYVLSAPGALGKYKSYTISVQEGYICTPIVFLKKSNFATEEDFKKFIKDIFDIDVDK